MQPLQSVLPGTTSSDRSRPAPRSESSAQLFGSVQFRPVRCMDHSSEEHLRLHVVLLIKRGPSSETSEIRIYALTADGVVFTVAVDTPQGEHPGTVPIDERTLMVNTCACRSKPASGRMTAVGICRHSYGSALADAWELLARQEIQNPVRAQNCPQNDRRSMALRDGADPSRLTGHRMAAHHGQRRFGL